jgi:hypothetical protein
MLLVKVTAAIIMLKFGAVCLRMFVEAYEDCELIYNEQQEIMMALQGQSTNEPLLY